MVRVDCRIYVDVLGRRRGGGHVTAAVDPREHACVVIGARSPMLLRPCSISASREEISSLTRGRRQGKGLAGVTAPVGGTCF